MSELTPIEQKEIEFQGREITAVLVQDEDGRENIYVPLRPLVEGMGLSWSGARERVNRTTALNEVCMSVRVTRTDIEEGSTQPKHSDMLSIPISHLNGFLFGVSEHRVKPELKQLVIAYQRECYQVLFEAFNGIESMVRFYRAIGHDEGWINARVAKHYGSTKLGDIWLINGVPIEYHKQLQDQLSTGAFGITVEEHRQLKQLPDRADLQDNMSRIELAISLMADEAAREIAEGEGATGLDEHTVVTKRAGTIAGNARRMYEEGVGKQVLTSQNNLDKRKRPLLASSEEE